MVFLGQIDEQMADDLWSIKFDVIKEWQDVNLLPLIQRFYLFAGLGGTLYHCHYDLQPNLHVQLTGRKRFILFSPDDWAHLYPFPVHHDLDRRSQVDLDAPDSSVFPDWGGAKGYVVELNPGDALYIPPYWWHHVQSLTPETTSMAMWFFEYFPQSTGQLFGLSPETDRGIVLMREVEEFIGSCFPDVEGEEDCTKARPVKAGQVQAFVNWMKPKVGMPARPGGKASAPPPLLTMPAERVQQGVLDMIKDKLGLAGPEADHLAAKRVRAFWTGRF